MVNGGLVATGIIITAFALLLLNPALKFPDLGWFSSPIPTNTIEWTIVAAMIFAIVFLTGAAMMAKGFLERKVVKSTALREVEAA
jgi:hypothetical protein